MRITSPGAAAHLLAALVISVAAPAAGPVSIDGIQFADHGASGVIDLGAPRGGVGVIDFDDDGYPDLVLGDTAGRLQRLFHNVPDPLRPGERTFVDVTAGSGFDDADATQRSGEGVLVADYDNDSDRDVFIVGRRHSAVVTHGLLLRNDDGSFENVSVDSGVRAEGYVPGSASWNDFDLDGDVDLLILCTSSDTTRVRLLRNDGDGTFTDQSDLMPFVGGSGNVYSHTWVDFDGDGWDDCYALWNGPHVLRNVPDGRGGRMFVDDTVATGFTTLGPAPMGLAAGDHDNDGDLDLAVSNGIAGEYYDNEAGTLTRVFPFTTIWAWGVTWLDVDNDGDLDHIQCGSVGQGANFDVCIRNRAAEGEPGSWDDISGVLNGVSEPTRYAVQVDYDNDGRLDVVAVSPDVFVSVYENVSTTDGHWLTVRLRGDGTRVNRDAIGAVVRVTADGVTRMRAITSGSSSTATEDLRAHFGLGTATSVSSIEVRWPRRGSLSSRTDTYPGPFGVDAIIEIVARCPEDLDEDGVVGFLDLLITLGSWGACADCPADLDGDGGVAFPDLLTLLAAWGPCP
jgi:hypothetical protein